MNYTYHCAMIVETVYNTISQTFLFLNTGWIHWIHIAKYENDHIHSARI
jgi:hypothetical protein